MRARLLPLLVLLPALSGAAPDTDSWVRISSPPAGLEMVGPVGGLEVRGVAGVGAGSRFDVVIALDWSGSTALASGADVDGDGHLGRPLRSSRDPLRPPNPNRLSSDPGDTVLAAEIAAARRLLERLDPARSRVGLVGFAATAEVLAPVGADRTALDRALEELGSGRFSSGATNLAAALDTALEALDAAPPDGARSRVVVLLSDGTPTEPAPVARAAERARGAAERAARAGVRVDSFALGVEPMEGSGVFAEMAERSGGRAELLTEPGDVLLALPRLRLAAIRDVRVRNATTGDEARATRIFPDGSFDAWVPLVPGENRIVATAEPRGGPPVAAESRVHFQYRPARSPAEAEAAQATLERLQRRTLETELAVEAEQRREGETERVLELETPPPLKSPDALPIPY